MQQNDDKALIPVPIASEAASGNVATIPTTQATAGDGRVSIDLGYPPECAISVAAGGKYPEMQDANGVYKLLSSAIRAIQAWGVLPFNDAFAAAIGGYPKYAVCVDSAGAYWVSTADSNTTTPGATDASWQSLFNGYATEVWANGQFLQLAATALQTVTGPVAFNGATTVPDITVFTGKNAINAKTADARYGKLSGGNSWEDEQDFSGDVVFSGESGNNAKIINAPPDPADGVAGDVTNSWWVENYYARKSMIPTAGTITGGTYTKTPMNDGTGRSVLVQTFTGSKEVQGGVFISFPIAYSVAPVVLAGSLGSGDSQTDTDYWVYDITTSGFTFNTRSFLGNFQFSVQGIVT